MEKIIIPVVILTYHRADYFRRTLESFLERNKEHLSMFRIIVLVQGGKDKGTARVLAANKRYLHTIEYRHENIGCAKGYALAMREGLKLGQPYMMYLQDDWESNTAVAPYVPEILEMMEEHVEVGYIRLRVVRERVHHMNRISRERIRYWGISNHILISTAHFSMNPQIIKSSVVQEIIPFAKEKIGMVNYEKLGLKAAQLNPGCFGHIGINRAISMVKGRKRWIK